MKINEFVKTERNEIYSDIFNSVNVFLFAHDLDGNFIITNNCFEDAIGYSKSELQNTNIIDLIPERYKPEFNCYLKRIKAIGYDYNKMRVSAKDGDNISIEYRSSIIQSPSGRKYIRVVCQDITEQIKAQKALRKSEKKLKQSEQRYRDIFENINEGIYIHDLSGNFVDINYHFINALGYSRHELKTKNIKDLIPEQYKLEFDDYLKRIQVKGYEKGLFQVITKDGRNAIVEYTNSLVQGEEGPVAVRGVARDITKAFKAQNALKKSEEKLRVVRDDLEKRVQERTKALTMSNKKLEEKTKDLEETNIALRVLLKRKDNAQKEVEEEMLANIKELITPLLKKMKLDAITSTQKSYLKLIESNLNNLIAPFAVSINSKYYNLTPAEIQVANLVREGKTSNKIASLLNLKVSTINTHRDNIRIKLGIKNKKLNLRSHLTTLQN